jgi:TAG lipase / steryl ester hydrolase / phospholipase A2 / LPA acyltransferase
MTMRGNRRRTTEGELPAIPNLDEAQTYQEWKAAALADDERTGAAEWRKRDPSRRYDFRVIRFRYNELCEIKAKGDPHELMYCLNEGIHGNMGGMGRPALYTRARFGTKDLITQYIAELADALEQMARVDDRVIPFEEKLDFFRRASHCFGRSALMLSGGGSLGPFHLGVAKSLIEHELLPSVISGASAGAFVAAVLGTHDDAGFLKRLEGIRGIRGQGELWGAQVPEQRSQFRMGIQELRAVVEDMIPDLTFQEAFDLTGRQINISVSPSELHQSSRLLNAITSPSVLIREAVLASCSIPGIYPPVTLAAKGRDGVRRPYVPSRKWIDGSISSDLPERRLARLYGVNYFITSQTNPMVLWAVRDTGWDDSSLSARLFEVSRAMTREWIRSTYPTAMRLLKKSYPLNMYARMAFSVATQDYTADVNILPRKRFWDPRKLLSMLTESEIRYLIREGEKATWPKIEMLRNCTRIGRTLDRILTEYEHVHTARGTAERRARPERRPRGVREVSQPASG